jgi:hypothetical protein
VWICLRYFGPSLVWDWTALTYKTRFEKKQCSFVYIMDLHSHLLQFIFNYALIEDITQVKFMKTLYVNRWGKETIYLSNNVEIPTENNIKFRNISCKCSRSFHLMLLILTLLVASCSTYLGPNKCNIIKPKPCAITFLLAVFLFMVKNEGMMILPSQKKCLWP